MSDQDNLGAFPLLEDDNWRKSAYVPTAVNVAQLTRAQADIAKLCAQIAVDKEFALQVWRTLDKAGFIDDSNKQGE